MKGASIIAGSVAICLCATSSFAQAPPAPAVGETPTVSAAALPVRLDHGTMIRLMVVNEVSTKTAHVGDRFVLRVDEDVKVGDVKLIPVGTKAWGEVVSAEESGAIGKAGRLSARLLYVDLPTIRLPIRGDRVGDGPGGAGTTVLAVLGLGVFGLFARGTNAKLKAGEIFNAYVDEDMTFDPADRSFRPAAKQPLILPASATK